MITRLVIKNIALIEYAQLDFKKGLNVLSGETGSGKSVILESINFVLGDKADKSLIRTGANECYVEAEFDVFNNQAILNLFDEFEMDREDVLIVSRKFTLEGRSNIKINGNTVTASILRKFTSQLVDVHGQSEHFFLLNTGNQLNLLDKYCGEKVLSLKNEINKDYIEYSSVRKSLDEILASENHREIRIDVLKYQINEIQKADIKEDEEETLLNLKEKLKNQEKIVNSLSLVKQSFTAEGGIFDITSNAIRSLSTISSIDEKYSTLSERLNSCYAELEDLSDQCQNLLEDFSDNEYSLDEIQERLNLIKSLKKKYGNDYSEIQEFLSKAIVELEQLENSKEVATNLVEQKEMLSSKLYKNYLILSEKRKNGAKQLSDKIVEELTELGMGKAKFTVDFAPLPQIEDCKFAPNGIDEIQFLFSANFGEPLKPLREIISGGEMSRFMLAIKAQSAKYNDVSTYIFDEIDAGISGNVAKIVSHKFAKIAKDVQIISVTHLPQISSMADNNLLISKTESDNKTVTSVKNLSYEQKVDEVTRLVGGTTDNENARNLAKELIKDADNYKKAL